MTVIVFLVMIVVTVMLLIFRASSNEAQRVEQVRQRREEQERADAEFVTNRGKFAVETFRDWPFVTPADIDGVTGLIGMDGQGRAVRLVGYERSGTTLSLISDISIETKMVAAVKIDQPTKSRVVTHNDKTPVAVTNSKGSPVGRALVGGAIAGPLGVVAGGLSGAAVKSSIEHVDTKRSETVYYKGHPLLIIEFDDLSTPRRIFRFDTVRETNDWSSRIFTAMNRARRAS